MKKQIFNLSLISISLFSFNSCSLERLTQVNVNGNPSAFFTNSRLDTSQYVITDDSSMNEAPSNSVYREYQPSGLNLADSVEILQQTQNDTDVLTASIFYAQPIDFAKDELWYRENHTNNIFKDPESKLLKRSFVDFDSLFHSNDAISYRIGLIHAQKTNKKLDVISDLEKYSGSDPDYLKLAIWASLILALLCVELSPYYILTIVFAVISLVLFFIWIHQNPFSEKQKKVLLIGGIISVIVAIVLGVIILEALSVI